MWYCRQGISSAKREFVITPISKTNFQFLEGRTVYKQTLREIFGKVAKLFFTNKEFSLLVQPLKDEGNFVAILGELRKLWDNWTFTCQYEHGKQPRQEAGNIFSKFLFQLFILSNFVIAAMSLGQLVNLSGTLKSIFEIQDFLPYA